MTIKNINLNKQNTYLKDFKESENIKSNPNLKDVKESENSKSNPNLLKIKSYEVNMNSKTQEF